MRKIYVFYADKFWFEQFVMNSAVLILMGCFRKKKKVWIRAPGAAGALATVQTLALLSLGGRPKAVVAVFVATGPITLWLYLRERQFKSFVCDLMICLMLLLLFGGMFTALGGRQEKGVPGLLAVAFVVVVSGLLLRWLYETARVQQLVYPVVLEFGGRQERCQGFFDTGNRLLLPSENRPVHIVEESVLRVLVEGTRPVGTVRYHTLGKKDGKLEVYRLNMRVEGIGANCVDAGEPVKVFPKIAGWRGKRHSKPSGVWMEILAAAGDRALFSGRPYQVILNGNGMEIY